MYELIKHYIFLLLDKGSIFHAISYCSQQLYHCSSLVLRKINFKKIFGWTELKSDTAMADEGLREHKFCDSFTERYSTKGQESVGKFQQSLSLKIPLWQR